MNDDSLADRIDHLARRARMSQHDTRLTLIYLDAAIEDVRELERLHEAIRGACLHYGPDPIKKWDSGRCPAFCAICGEVMYRWQ